MCRPLVAYWIESPANPLFRFGVTGFSFDDAIAILRHYGYGECLPADLAELRVTENVRYDDLDPRHIHPNMGPIVVRGLWYPFYNVAPPEF